MASFSDALKGHVADALVTYVNGEEVRTYSGTVPANADTALSGNAVLSTHPSISAVTSTNTAVITVGDDLADASGQMSFIRIYRAGVCVYQGTVGVDVTVDDPNIIEGGNVSFNSFVLAVG